jgi:hypothetical protein
LCGDFNVNFTRGGHNANRLLRFIIIQDLNLARIDLYPNVKYTYRRDDQTSYSWPDLIITLSHYVHLINDVARNESVDNFSDHLLLSFTLRSTHSLTLASSQSQSLASKSCSHPVISQGLGSCRVDWARVSDLDRDNYCE